jgi:uncharacterized HAD superfamily protein
MSLRIGVDLDGVLYQWEKTARYMLRHVLPNSPYSDDGPLGVTQTHWNYIRDNISPEHDKWLWREGVRLGLFRHGHLYPGSIEAVRELAAIGEVIIITHRPKQAVCDTLAWLAYQQFPLSGVHLLTNQEPKSSVRPMCNVYLDDKPANCWDLAENTQAQLVALFERPWNVGPQPWRPGLLRVHSWREFIDAVRALEERVVPRYVRGE